MCGFGGNVQTLVQRQGLRRQDPGEAIEEKPGWWFCPLQRLDCLSREMCPLSLCSWGWQGSDQVFLFLLKVLAMGQDFISCNVLRK